MGVEFGVRGKFSLDKCCEFWYDYFGGDFVKKTMWYLDSCASTKPLYNAETYRTETNWLNPNAGYAVREKKMIAECEQTIKKAIGGEKGHVFFGGVASQLMENFFNWIYNKCPDYDIYTNITDHDSLYRFEMKRGYFSQNVIYTTTPVNNIVGLITRNEAVIKKQRKYGNFIFCDATAMAGHVKIENADELYDAVAVSGHKFNAPKAGFLWVSDRLYRDAYMYDFKIHGTPDQFEIKALTDAFVWANTLKIQRNENAWKELEQYLYDKLSENNIDFSYVIENEPKTPAITAIILNGINSDSLQQFAASRNVFIGIGHSACDAESDYRILVDGYGLTEKQARETVRISFDWNTDAEDIDKFVECVVDYKKRFVR